MKVYFGLVVAAYLLLCLFQYIDGDINKIIALVAAVGAVVCFAFEAAFKKNRTGRS